MTPDSIPPTLLAASESDELPGSASALGAGPGRAIRAARERARLTLEELATQTKLARSTLEALERDDFNALNEAVYVRGYYRKCAKVLGLPEAELIAAYEKLAVPKAPQVPTKLLLGSSPAIGRPRIRRRGGMGRLILLVALTAIIAAVIWFRVNDPSLSGLRAVAPGAASTATTPAAVAQAPAPEAASASAEPAPTAEPPAPGALAGPSVPATTFEAPATTAAPATPPASPSPAPAPAASAAGAAPATQAASPGVTLGAAANPAAPETLAGQLVLSFKATSWVRVEDADGRLLLSGVLQAGDRQQLHGRPPYSLFVGNAPGVTVEYDGKPIDTTPFVKANSTARLTVP